MFKGLSVKSNFLEDDSVVIPSTALEEIISNLSTIPPSRVVKNDRSRARREMLAFIDVIETHGLSIGLLAFANHDGNLSKIINSVPAFESLDSDACADETTMLLTDLKTIVEKDTLAIEELRGPLQWIITILGLWSGIIPGIVAYVAFSSWNDSEDRKKEARDLQNHPERIATVQPYNEIMRRLAAVKSAPDTLVTIIKTPLPTTKEEYEGSFFSTLRSEIQQIDDLGVELGTKNGDDEIYTYPNSKPQSRDITKLGYGENSLVNIVNIVKECDNRVQKLRQLQQVLDKLTVIDTDEESRRYSAKGIHLLNDLAHVILTLTIKTLRDVKQTCRSIEHFYKKG